MTTREAHQVNGLRLRFAFLGAPGLAPEPLLWQREHPHVVPSNSEGKLKRGELETVLQDVGEILVEVGQGVRVAAEVVVGRAQNVGNALAPELVDVDDVERRDVVGLALELVLPIAAGPEAEALGRRVGVVARAEGGVAVRCALLGSEEKEEERVP